MKERKITLYTKSNKTTESIQEMRRKVISQNLGPAPGGMAPPPPAWLVWDTETETVHMFVLPEEQKRIVEMVKEIAQKHDFEVDVVDVTRMNALNKILKKEIRELKAFPTLITESGRKLDTDFSREKIEQILSEEETAKA